MSDVRWALPESWIWADAGAIADVIGGGTPAAKNPENFSSEGIPWVTPADLTGYSDVYIERGARDLSEMGYASCSAKLMPKGAVLFSSRAPIGYCAIAANEIATNQGFKSLVLTEGMLPEFVRLYLMSSKSFIEGKASGTTFREISGSRMAKIPVPIPPPLEQRRIVAKLDRLSARSAAARDHLARTTKLATRAKQAILGAVFEEGATASWNEVVLGAVVSDSLVGLVRSKSQQSDQGTPYIRMNHYDYAGSWNSQNLTCVTTTDAELERYELHSGDVLFNTRNSAELVGKVGLWPDDKPGHVYNNNLLRLRFVEAIVPKFAYYFMTSPVFRSYLASVTSATTSVAAIYQKSLMKGPFRYPDIEYQEVIVRRIEGAFARIDRLTEEATRAAHLLDRLDERLLAKAFRGELVPQNPDDEPADALLARLRQARAAAPKPKRRKKAAT